MEQEEISIKFLRIHSQDGGHTGKKTNDTGINAVLAQGCCTVA